MLPHRASRAEDWLHTVIEDRLTSRGWTPRVVPHVGYGADGWVRVLARVLLTPPGSSEQDPADRRGWRRFVSASAAGIPFTIRVGTSTHHVASDRDGYLDVRVSADLEPGWTTAEFILGDTDSVKAPLRIVGPDTKLGLVSDIDDTVIVTMLPRPLVAFRNAFLVRESARTPVPGMAELYAEIVAAHPDVFVAYVSTGAWNTAGALTRFLRRHGFPAGPLLLTDWGPSSTGWFRSGQDHKRAQLRRLLDELPDLRWLLVGDDGQHDPSLYAEVVEAEPDRVLGVAIRQLSFAEQVVRHAVPTDRSAEHPSTTRAGGPVLAADGFGLRQELHERGLVIGPHAS